MGRAAAPAAVRRALAPNASALDVSAALDVFTRHREPRRRGSLHSRRARFPNPTLKFGLNALWTVGGFIELAIVRTSSPELEF